MSLTSENVRATKILATVGSACESAGGLAALLDAGVNVFRLNFSHGTQKEHGERIKTIRALEADRQNPCCILADTISSFWLFFFAVLLILSVVCDFLLSSATV